LLGELLLLLRLLLAKLLPVLQLLLFWLPGNASAARLAVAIAAAGIVAVAAARDVNVAWFATGAAVAVGTNVAAVTAIIVAVTAPGEGRVLARERSFPFAT
jgi:hypothetical protein